MRDRPTFSPFWHRVRALKPRLRPHVQITRQRYRGRRWHVCHDPSSNQFYRLTPIAYEFVCLLGGDRTVEEAWDLSLARHGDQAPTQNEAIELLSQLYNSNLLSVDVTPETEQLLRRGRERTARRMKSQAVGLMYFRIRLFNPDAIMAWIEPVVRPLINKWGFLLWVAFVASGLYALLPHWQELMSGVDTALAPSNWGWMIAVFIATKAIHETGHGVICKRFGGQVPEFGVMLLVLFPSPYVDASACWAFPSKWQRMAVGAGGMIFELAIAAAAAWTWVATRGTDQILVHQLAYHAMFIASVSTILFNANPLMRFDGYYILSDLLEVPNLMQRSTSHLKYLMQRHVYRIRDARPITSSPAEQSILTTYGILALAYRVFLFFSITLYIMGKLFALGLVLALWTAAVWFVAPIGKLVNWLATNPQLADKRPRAIATTIALAAAVLFLVGAVPMPDRRRASGVIESVARSGVFIKTEGFIRAAHARPGDRVRKGDPIITLESPQVQAELDMALAQRAEFAAIEREVTATSPAAAQVARQRLDALDERIAQIRRRVDELVVRAEQDGIIVAGDPAGGIGALAKRGQPVCEIVDPARSRIAAAMTQAESAWLFENRSAGSGQPDYSAQIRLVSRAQDAKPARVLQVLEAGRIDLPHTALGFAGGGNIPLDPRDDKGLFAKSPQFYVYLETDPADSAGPWGGLPGERVKLRFTLPSRPLLAQWVDRLQKLIQGRINI